MKRVLAAVVILVVVGFAISRKSVQTTQAVVTEATESAQSKPITSLSASPTAVSPAPLLASTAAHASSVSASDPQQELRTIESFSDLFAAAHETATPASLVRELKRVGLSPIGSRDADETTGSMIVVETENTLPGSRYFRAQFFSDAQGVYQLQHMSFELKPGTSVDEVVGQLNRSLGPLPHMSYADADWKAWKLPGHYTLSIQKLNGEDVTETALHAYSPSDVGTLRVALEADLPGHDDEPL